MTKQLKLIYILSFVFTGIIVAWNTLSAFFGGVGINFVATIALSFIIFMLAFNSKLFKQVKDIFIVVCTFCVLELFVFFAFEFGWSNANSIEGFLTYQTILSILAFFVFAYFVFRFVCENQNKKIRFIEIMLGNEKRAIKVKKEKEVSNGSLEAKPNKKHSNISEPVETEDDNIIIEESEE